jgi:peptide-methionine (S)-S-oxide reductase
MRTFLSALVVAAGAVGCGIEDLAERRDADPAPSVSAVPTAAALDTAIVAGGCFWCMEPPFDSLVGVVSTTSGYTAGRTANPTYEQVSGGETGHTEAVQIVFDPAKVSYDRLLTVFWRNVDPFARDQQFCDRGSQYRSGIYPRNAVQQRAAEASRATVAARFREPIATEIAPAGPFYAAEEYHQDYYTKNPVRYKYYRFSCGRDARLRKIWGGDEAPKGPPGR